MLSPSTSPARQWNSRSASASNDKIRPASLNVNVAAGTEVADMEGKADMVFTDKFLSANSGFVFTLLRLLLFAQQPCGNTGEFG